MAQHLSASQRLAVVLFLTLSFSLLAHGQEITHIVEPGTTSNAPVTSAEMDRRIENAADKYRVNAPIPRIVFYDLAYPASAEEYAELSGHALLLVTALSQDRAELPLKRVFVRLNGKELEIRLITSVLSQQKDAHGEIAATLGQYRVDSLYLFPLYLSHENAELFVDFAKNRDGFKLATFSDTESPETSYPLTKPPIDKAPSETVLKQMILREYPGFIKN